MYVNEVIAGVEHEVLPGLNMGVRYIHRDIPRVLEDVQPFPVVAFDLGLPGTQTIDYVLTNPGPSTAVQGDFGAAFETPIHRYNAIEVTADKRLSNRWTLQSSYRYSRLRGTYEGFYPRRQRAVRSGDHVVVRLSNQRSKLHDDRRAAVRLPRRRPLPRRGWGPVRSRSTVRTSSRRSATISSTWG